MIASWHERRPELDVEPIAITTRIALLQAELAPKLEAVFSRFGIRGADFAVLATLTRLAGEGVSQTRLASELNLSAGTVSLRVDRLLGRGLIERRPDPEDGRGALITLTGRGHDLFEACAPEHLANSRELLSGLTEGERDRLGALLGKLLSTLQDPGRDEELALGLGVVVDAAPIALERRRAVGLPPLAGLLVRHVDPAGPAAAAGIRPGDMLTSANGQSLRSHHDLRLALRDARGRALALEIIRGVEPLRIRLAPRATDPHRSR